MPAQNSTRFHGAVSRPAPIAHDGAHLLFSHAADQQVKQGSKRSFSGTPSYMAPKQAIAYDQVDARCDIYAIGAVAYHLLTGRPPYQGKSAGEVLMAHAQQAIPKPSAIDAGVPEDLDNIVVRCLAKEPADRIPKLTIYDPLPVRGAGHRMIHNGYNATDPDQLKINPLFPVSLESAMSPILRRSVGASILWLTYLVCIMAPAATVSAQQPDTSGTIGAESIPIDGMLVVMLSPAKAMQSAAVELMPTEVADGWCAQYIGLKPSEIETAKIIVAVPGPNGPMAAAVLKLNRDFDISTLHRDVIGDGQPIDVDGRSCLRVQSPADMVVHQVDARTVIVSSSNYLNSVISAAGDAARGALAKLADATAHEGQITVLFSVEPVRPIVTGFLQSMINRIPPPFVEFTVIPELTDAITIQLDIEDRQQGLKLTLLARDEDSAGELQKVVDNGLRMARDMALLQAAAQLEGQGPIADATQQYAQRLADHIVTSLTPKRSARRLIIATSVDQGFATQGVLMGLLLPAVQSARFAARRASSQNNLKQIALAMHNYNDAYNALPETAIRDGEGKPLLSWRVKILPFIQQQALYQQFHLDEPWNSPHNFKLIDQMPDVYKHPGVVTAPGFTVYQLPIGKNTLFKETGATRFRDVMDGTSNTILMMETNAENAVEWTKPADIEIDMDDPLASAGDYPPGQFTIALADGSVRIVDRDIDLDTLRALLTAAGGERVDF